MSAEEGVRTIFCFFFLGILIFFLDSAPIKSLKRLCVEDTFEKLFLKASVQQVGSARGGFGPIL